MVLDVDAQRLRLQNYVKTANKSKAPHGSIMMFCFRILLIQQQQSLSQMIWGRLTITL